MFITENSFDKKGDKLVHLASIDIDKSLQGVAELMGRVAVGA